MRLVVSICGQPEISLAQCRCFVSTDELAFLFLLLECACLVKMVFSPHMTYVLVADGILKKQGVYGSRPCSCEAFVLVVEELLLSMASFAQ